MLKLIVLMTMMTLLTACASGRVIEKEICADPPEIPLTVIQEQKDLNKPPLTNKFFADYNQYLDKCFWIEHGRK